MKQLIYLGPSDTRSLSKEDLTEIGVDRPKDPLTFTRGRALEVPVKIFKAVTGHESLSREFAEPQELSEQDLVDLTHGQEEDPELEEDEDEDDDDSSGDDSGDQTDT